jgi:hypothetical protein
MPTWKRLFVKTAGFGAGFAGVLVLFTVFNLRHQNRPVPPPSWNNSAITAQWIKVIPEKKNETLEFWYAVSNSTSDDYRLDGGAGRFFLRTGSGDVLSPKGEFGVPIFIPSKHTVRLEFFVQMQGYPEPLNASEDQVKKVLSRQSPQPRWIRDFRRCETLRDSSPGWMETVM